MNYYDDLYSRENVRRWIKEMRRDLDRCYDKTKYDDRLQTFTELEKLKAYLVAMTEEYKKCGSIVWPDNIDKNEEEEGRKDGQIIKRDKIRSGLNSEADG